jgi:hypothetical protein
MASAVLMSCCNCAGLAVFTVFLQAGTVEPTRSMGGGGAALISVTTSTEFEGGGAVDGEEEP